MHLKYVHVTGIRGLSSFSVIFIFTMCINKNLNSPLALGVSFNLVMYVEHVTKDIYAISISLAITF